MINSGFIRLLFIVYVFVGLFNKYIFYFFCFSYFLFLCFCWIFSKYRVVIWVIDNNFFCILIIYKFIIKSIFNIESIIGNIVVVFREKFLNRWGLFYFYNFLIFKMWMLLVLWVFQVIIILVEWWLIEIVYVLLVELEIFVVNIVNRILNDWGYL